MTCAPARHPFRSALPPHVLGELMVIAPPPRFPLPALRPRRYGANWFEPPRLAAQDLRDFLTAYCACFLAVSAFIW